MKKNKLQEYADKSLSKYDKPDLCKQILKENISGECNANGERAIKRSTKNWILSLSIFFIIGIISFGSYMLWTNKPKEKTYLLENQNITDISFDEFESAVKGIQIERNLTNSVKRVDDNLYKETLYYRLAFLDADTSENLEIVIVQNVNYHYEFPHEEYNLAFSLYEMNYIEQFNEEDGLYSFNCKGEFSVSDIMIYVQYDGIGFEPQSNFLNFLQQCITIN